MAENSKNIRRGSLNIYYPSPGDKDITKELVFAGNLMQIEVLDHIIIGNNRFFSFADEGLIEEYDRDFLGFKKGINV